MLGTCKRSLFEAAKAEAMLFSRNRKHGVTRRTSESWSTQTQSPLTAGPRDGWESTWIQDWVLVSML